MAKNYSAQKWEGLKEANKGTTGPSTPQSSTQVKFAAGSNAAKPKAQVLNSGPRSTPPENQSVKFAK